MPESRSRKRTTYKPPSGSSRRPVSESRRRPVKVGRSSRWIAPAMVTCWVLGLAWIVLFYLAPDLPYVRDLGNWNLAIGMALIAVGFVFSTKWE